MFGLFFYCLLFMAYLLLVTLLCFGMVGLPTLVDEFCLRLLCW